MFVSSESDYQCVHIGLYRRPFRITTARSGPPAVVNDTVRVGVGAAIGDNRQVDVEHESPGVEDLVPDLLFNSLRQFRDLIYGAMRARDGARPSGIARSSRCATASMARTPARSAVSA